ncbi:hypothetical protein CTI12_AA229960 [Artemisia annua]|uniref:Uncharacterized protein n=1 Tax=Artemisia annua TaxID=35608 RepID=A0A2U1NTC4_ARTAN|nr:hypothetical protein CTI12_AA229960 [Artemisia annua]
MEGIDNEAVGFNEVWEGVETVTIYIRRGMPDAGFALFESESLKWPGFVEFDDVNGKVLTFSAQDRFSIEAGTVLKTFNHLLYRNKKVDFVEQFNEKLLVKQENENLQILDVRNSELTEVSRTEFMTPSAFIFLYENQLFLTFRNRTVAVWNFRWELVTSFEDHLLWHPDCNTNNIYITSDQDLIISYCKADSDESESEGNGMEDELCLVVCKDLTYEFQGNHSEEVRMVQTGHQCQILQTKEASAEKDLEVNGSGAATSVTLSQINDLLINQIGAVGTEADTSIAEDIEETSAGNDYEMEECAEKDLDVNGSGVATSATLSQVNDLLINQVVAVGAESDSSVGEDINETDAGKDYEVNISVAANDVAIPHSDDIEINYIGAAGIEFNKTSDSE